MAADASFRPVASVLLAVALFSLMDALMKGASLAAGTYSALFVRGLCGLTMTVPLYLFSGGRVPARTALAVHVRRGLVSTAMAFTFFWGITQMPLAEAIALSFIAPLLALYLAAVLLGEHVSRRAIGASLIGFSGVAVIAAARLNDAGPGAHSALGLAAIMVSALLYAWNLILQRQQALLARPIEVALFQNAVVTVALAGFAPWFLSVPESAATWGLIAASALLAMLAAMLVAWGYARAETQALVAYEYSAFLWAGLFGWLFFAEAVSPATLIGAVLIVAACWVAAPRKRAEAALV